MRDSHIDMPEDAGAGAGRRQGARTVRLGFIPLIDCAIPAVAAEKGFARAEGLDLVLVRDVSWANIRDKVNLGHLDGAHMLAGMPIASSLGIGHVKVPMLAPMALGLGGNAIVMDRAVWREMCACGTAAGDEPLARGRALRAVIERRAAAGREPMTIAMVFPFSSHNYELRYWLAAAGIHPDRDVRLVVIPPSLMVESLRAGQIQGFCAGAPWPNLAAEAGLGTIVATKAELWQRSPNKVLGVPKAWADAHPETLAALLRALHAASRWAGATENREELAELLAGPAYLDTDRALLSRILAGDLGETAVTARAQPDPDFVVFHRNCATFPWRSHALWFYSQMVRWGQVAASPEAAALAAGVYRPDLLRGALAPLGVPVPAADFKIEGALETETPVAALNGDLSLASDRFFDGRTFDPDRIEAYLASFPAL